MNEVQHCLVYIAWFSTLPLLGGKSIACSVHRSRKPPNRCSFDADPSPNAPSDLKVHDRRAVQYYPITTSCCLRRYENFCLAIVQVDYGLLMHEYSVILRMRLRDSLLLVPVHVYAIFARVGSSKRGTASQSVILPSIELCSGPIRESLKMACDELYIVGRRGEG